MDATEANGPTAGEDQPPGGAAQEPAIPVSRDIFLPPLWREDNLGARPVDRAAPAVANGRAGAEPSVPSPSPVASMVPIWGPIASPSASVPAGPVGQSPSGAGMDVGGGIAGGRAGRGSDRRGNRGLFRPW